MYVQDGSTALYIASGKGHVSVVQLLLQKHADIRISETVKCSIFIIMLSHLNILTSNQLMKSTIECSCTHLSLKIVAIV